VLQPAGRFAPAPTGELHAGHLLTAGLAWASARRQGLRFVLRLEDLDAPRQQPGSAEKILATLARAGLDWDEDWVRGGPCAPYRQSERLDHYRAALEQLRAANLVYPCACSRAEISVSAPQGPEGPVYPGICRDQDSGAILARCAELRRPPAWRFRVRPGLVTFTDGARGSQTDEPEKNSGDFVIARGDSFSYQLAVVVDDAAMGVREVLRGGDLLGSTARQLLLYEALELPAPKFIHGPLLVNADGVKLSKRDRSLAADSLLERRGAGFWAELCAAVSPEWDSNGAGASAALNALLARLPELPATARLSA
jgi:glutamyl-tRNA synthetase